MKSQKGLIIVVVVLLLLGAGYFFFNQNATKTLPGIGQQKGGGVFSSIQDALSRSLTLQCEYPDDKGNKTTVYIKGGAIRVMGYSVGEGQAQGHTLMKDNKMYIWNDDSKEGMVFAFNPQEIQKSAESIKNEMAGAKQTANQGEDFVKGLEQYKQYCKSASVPDSVFSLPSGIKFVDLEQQMKDSGVDVQKMMQQYGQ